MNNRLKSLKSVMAVQTTSYNTKLMNKYIKEEVAKIRGCKLYKKDGNIYVTRGEADIYPCVVAHTDTVHDIYKNFYVQRHKDVLYAINGNYERVGIGGDDKVGVFVALETLKTLDVCKVAFFRDEEVGCVGSKLADMSFFTDVSMVLQCDRQGYADFVSNIFWTELYPHNFSQAIAPILEDYGRVESDGGMTDVWQLAENGLGVACANMSCGYYDPHSDNEYIIISEVMRTLDFVLEALKTLGDVKWEISHEDRGGNYRYGGYGSYGGRSKPKYEYRRYGKGKEDLSNGDAWDEFVAGRDNDDTDDDYIVENVSCCACDGKESVAYDDSVDMYWCYGCQDYVREEMLDFSANDKMGDEFLKHVNAYQQDEQDKEV